MSTLKVDGIRSNSASSDAITLANDGTCTANITNNLSNRNLIINGAMQVAQRGTSATNSGYGSVDRMYVIFSGTDESPTHAQADVASGTTPYTLGFRKCLKVTNGNQTSGADAGDLITIQTRLEAQDIANSGWNYTSASSFITVQFWIKSSVAQTFKGYIRTKDGTGKIYPFDTGSLSADTWTKITKTIPGHADLQFDNNVEQGIQVNIAAFWGTNYTDNSVTENAWADYAGSTRTKDNTSTWYTTNDATLEFTGMQLEVGSVATDFEHRSFADELRRCQRYYQRQAGPSDAYIQPGKGQGTTAIDAGYALSIPLRAEPTVACGSNRVFMHNGYSNSTTAPSVIQWSTTESPYSSVIALRFSGHSSITSNYVCAWCPTFGSVLTLDAEI